MLRKNLLLLFALPAIFVGSLLVGRWMRSEASAQVDVIPTPGSLPAACRGITRVTSVEKVEADNNSETFLVKWTNTFACQTDASINLAVTRADGQTRNINEKVSGNATQKLIKVGLLPDGNRAKSVRAEVTAAGEQRSIAEKTVTL